MPGFFHFATLLEVHPHCNENQGFILLLRNSVSLYGYNAFCSLITSWWTLELTGSTLGLLWKRLLRTFQVQVYASISLGWTPRNRVAGSYSKVMFNILTTAMIFKVGVPCLVLTNKVQRHNNGCACLYILANLCYCLSLCDCTYTVDIQTVYIQSHFLLQSSVDKHRLFPRLGYQE